MIFTYDIKNNKVSIPEETTFKKHNILERRNIEKWIEDYPDILGEELLVLTTEFDKFDKTSERLDLLALDRDGNLVVVELKRDDSGKNTELQAIKYAAYCSTLTFDQVINLHSDYLQKRGESVDQETIKAKLENFIENDEFENFSDKPRIILVAREFRPEVTASVIWLRKFGIDITCIKITPYIHDETTITIESSILIPLPEAKEFLIQIENKEKSEERSSLYRQKYLEFFSDLKQRLGDRIPKNSSTPLPRNYFQIPTGLNRVHYEWIFRGKAQKSFGVELHFETEDKSLNQKLLSHCMSRQKELEMRTNEKVNITKDWGERWAKLSIEKNTGEMTEELKEWAVQTMLIFYEVFQPELDKFKNTKNNT